MKVLAFLFGLALLAGCASTAPQPKQYLVSHIMCATEQDANQALARLRTGESFEQVAEKVSIDPGTRREGGKIGRWTTADAWSANFADEVRKLGVGQTSAKPIRTEFGWHIVRVDAVR